MPSHALTASAVSLPSPLRFSLWLIWILASALVAAYGWMLIRIERAEALYWESTPDAAVDAFAQLDGSFRERWWLARILPADRDRVAGNYLRLLYARGDYDRVIEEGEAMLLGDEDPSELVRYWLGNAYYRKAVATDPPVEPEEAVAWLRRAGEQYQEAIARSSMDWDLKYNHELVQTLLARMNTKASEEKVFDLLRPQDKNGPQPPQPRGGRIG
jgi:tetratricopeptide (TPR) repeat protein